jgi:hypothetical protein
MKGLGPAWLIGNCSLAFYSPDVEAQPITVFDTFGAEGTFDGVASSE